MTTRFKVATWISIFTALFWFSFGRIFTDERVVLVPMFVVVALAVFVAYCCVSQASDDE